MFHFNKYKTKNIGVDYLIVGLGNIGVVYEGTRHNSGFESVDRIAKELNVSFNMVECEAHTATAQTGEYNLLLAKPTTFMNLSGRSVSALMAKYELKPEQLIVLYDDLDLAVGALRMRAKGSAGTHNGMRDIVSTLGYDNFCRIRIGIGRPGEQDIKDFVLGKPFGTERELWLNAADIAAKATLTKITKGNDIAMRLLADYNHKLEAKSTEE